jgi:branched-subunit amino acid aminotransferase/4-amino-4-deoxychorismate lyase
MEQHEQLLVWSDDAGLIDGIPRDRTAEQAPLLVADSWLMSDGRVRALDLHAARFAAGCAEVGYVPADTVARFWTTVVDRLPDEGAWFPRVELASVPLGRLALRIRSAPRRTQSVRVWLPATADPRQTPRRKGPDLGVLADLRQAAIAAGANEALLRTADGVVLEGATTNLLWWDGDALCVPSPTLPVLPGVTSRLIQDEAIDRGIEVRYARCGVEALLGREVWFVNALHGIRPVTAWIGADVQPGATTRSGAWRAWLDELPEPIDAARVVSFPRGDSRTRS